MLKAGFSRLDVTPPFGAELAGYYTVRHANGILDPILLNAVAIANENETVLLMAIDFIGINIDYNLKIRKSVSECTGVPLDHIFVSAMHQHTSCALDHSFSRLTDDVYISVLIRKFADAAQMAIDDMKDAKIGTAAQETAEPIAFVRRYFAEDGSVHTNPNTDKVKIVKRCDEADNTVRLVRLFREGAKDIAIVNFSTHPDVIGGTKFSADWMGFTRRFVEADNPDVLCAFFTGTQGDSNHIDFFKPKSERIKGNNPDNKGYGHSEYMGRTVADTVKKIWDSVEPSDNDSIFTEYTVVYNKTNSEGIDEYDKYKAICEAFDNRTIDVKTVDIAYAHRIVNLRTSPILRPIPITVIGIGNITFVGFGGEPFSAYGRYVRALSPDKFIVCAVCTNGYEGYFPTEEAFEQGAYEARSSLFTPTVEKEIIGAIDNILKKF